jgi:hypothetical protein
MVFMLFLVDKKDLFAERFSIPQSASLRRWMIASGLPPPAARRCHDRRERSPALAPPTAQPGAHPLVETTAQTRAARRLIPPCQWPARHPHEQAAGFCLWWAGYTNVFANNLTLIAD